MTILGIQFNNLRNSQMRAAITAIFTTAIILSTAGVANAQLKINMNSESAVAGNMIFNYDLYGDSGKNASSHMRIPGIATSVDMQSVLSMLTDNFNSDADSFIHVKAASSLSISFPIDVNGVSQIVQCQLNGDQLQNANKNNVSINIPNSRYCSITPR